MRPACPLPANLTPSPERGPDPGLQGALGQLLPCCPAPEAAQERAEPCDDHGEGLRAMLLGLGVMDSGDTPHHEVGLLVAGKSM